MAIINLSDLFLAADSSVTHSASAWLTPVKHLQIFTRIQHYVLDKPQVERVVTLANIVVEDQHQRKGIFKNYLRYVESAAGIPVVVENIHNPILAAFLLRQGYTPLEKNVEDFLSLTYFKRKST